MANEERVAEVPSVLCDTGSPKSSLVRGIIVYPDRSTQKGIETESSRKTDTQTDSLTSALSSLDIKREPTPLTSPASTRSKPSLPKEEFRWGFGMNHGKTLAETPPHYTNWAIRSGVDKHRSDFADAYKASGQKPDQKPYTREERATGLWIDGRRAGEHFGLDGGEVSVGKSKPGQAAYRTWRLTDVERRVQEGGMKSGEVESREDGFLGDIRKSKAPGSK